MISCSMLPDVLELNSVRICGGRKHFCWIYIFRTHMCIKYYKSFHEIIHEIETISRFISYHNLPINFLLKFNIHSLNTKYHLWIFQAITQQAVQITSLIGRSDMGLLVLFGQLQIREMESGLPSRNFQTFFKVWLVQNVSFESSKWWYFSNMKMYYPALTFCR